MAKEFSAAQERRIAEMMRQFAATQLKPNYIGKGGILPGNISGGTSAGQLLATDSTLDPEWFIPPSALIWRNSASPGNVVNGTRNYVDFTDTLHSDGSITASPSTDRITINVTGKYLIGHNLLWKAVGSATLLNGSSVIEKNGTTDIAYNEALGYNTGGFSNNTCQVVELTAGDYLKVVYVWGGVAGSHGIYSEASAIGYRVCNLFACWVGPSS